MINKTPLKKITIIDLLKKIKKPKLGNETLLLENSKGRFMSDDMISKINLPPFKNSAVDGYAIHKTDIYNKKTNLFYKQRVAAGDKDTQNIKIGEATRIFTGAKMPLNSSTVIMQENIILNKKNYIVIKGIK